MGCVGNLAVAVILPVMGSIYDTGTLSALPERAENRRSSLKARLDADKLQGLAKTEPAVVKVAEIEGAGRLFARSRHSP